MDETTSIERVRRNFVADCGEKGMDDRVATVIAEMYERQMARARSDVRAATIEQMAWDSLSMEAQAELVRTMLRNEYGDQFDRLVGLLADVARAKGFGTDEDS